MNKITIFTPTYNRKETLKQLYLSLLEQKNKNFIWLIIDDGSTDGTEKMISNWINNSNLNIKYYRQSNLGKYMAFNTAITLCETEYICCVDSDDILVKNAIDIIINDIKKSKKNSIGFIYPRNSKINIIDNCYIDVMDIKFKYNINKETLIVIKNNVLINNKFPVNSTEKFMSEEVLYNNISIFGKFLYIDIPICCGNYLADGLTNNLINLWKKNYNNTILLFNSRYYFLNKYSWKIRIINKIKCIMNFNALNIVNDFSIFKNNPNKLLSIILYFPSIFYVIKKWR